MSSSLHLLYTTICGPDYTEYRDIAKRSRRLLQGLNEPITNLT